MAYVEIFGVPSNEFVQVLFGSKTIDIGPVKQYFYSGGFANGDFSVEYAIDYTAGDLYSIDTSNGVATRIGATITGDFIPYGPKWNPLTGTSYVIIRGGASCDSTGLYTINLITAATRLVGKSASCLSSMAIDPATGTMYAFDLAGDNFVVVDQATGAVQFFASGFPLNDASAMDFDPANGLLYVIGEDADPPNPVLYAYVPGSGLEGVGYLGKGFGGFAFAKRDGFFNGFETLGFILKPEDR